MRRTPEREIVARRVAAALDALKARALDAFDRETARRQRRDRLAAAAETWLREGGQR